MRIKYGTAWKNLVEHIEGDECESLPLHSDIRSLLHGPCPFVWLHFFTHYIYLPHLLYNVVRFYVPCSLYDMKCYVYMYDSANKC